LSNAWADEQIPIGSLWGDEVERALELSRVAILLVTPNYLASHFVNHVELPLILKACQERKLRLVWLAVSACLYGETVLAKFQAANDPSRPLDAMADAEATRTLVRIAELIKSMISDAGSEKLGPRLSDPQHELSRVPKRNLIQLIGSATLMSGLLTMFLGIVFRLWREEAELDASSYTVVFVSWFLLILLLRKFREIARKRNYK
jgi:hypothetical protein